jgi:hypothetical protein
MTPAKTARKALARLVRVTDNAMFLITLRYYTVLLKPGEWVELAQPRRAGSRRLNSAWITHLWIVRRLLQIASRPGSNPKKGRTCEYRLPANYIDTLYFATGLNLSEPVTRSRFEELPYDFRLPDRDAATRSFSAQHPFVLNRARRYLYEHYRARLPRGMDPPPLLLTNDVASPDGQETLFESLAALKALCGHGKNQAWKPPNACELLHRQALGFLSKVASGEE